MVYDYAIIGAGVAGTVCAYQLAQYGKSCIVFEKNSGPTEKICGGGVSYKALRRLEAIGIDIDPLFMSNSKRIEGHLINSASGISELKRYGSGDVSLGIQRSVFDTYLLNCAIDSGAAIHYGYTVRTVAKVAQVYKIDNYLAKDIVWAIGARNRYGMTVAGQSIGYSGQIYAKTYITPNIFHYWYYESGNDEKYFWAFPIGKNLWNVGVWSRYPFGDMKKEYNRCLGKIFLSTVQGKWKYFRMPKAEFLGHIDQREKETYLKYGIGDFAGTCNPLNGGGIIGAIDSAIQFVQNVCE